VRLDLGRQRVGLQAERSHEARAEERPVDRRKRRDVGVEITHRAIQLTENRDAGKTLALALEPGRDIREFFPHRRGVAVCPCVRASMPTAA